MWLPCSWRINDYCCLGLSWLEMTEWCLLDDKRNCTSMSRSGAPAVWPRYQQMLPLPVDNVVQRMEDDHVMVHQVVMVGRLRSGTRTQWTACRCSSQASWKHYLSEFLQEETDDTRPYLRGSMFPWVKGEITGISYLQILEENILTGCDPKLGGFWHMIQPTLIE